LKTLKGCETRPTSDRVKESVFNIIAKHLENAHVLDLFAGSGNLGIEALSRSALQAVFVDINGDAVSVIRENLMKTRLAERGTVIRGDALKVLYNLSKDGKRFDIIFIDPPYKSGLLGKSLDIIEKEGLLKETGVVVAERSSNDSAIERAGNLKLARDCVYGNTAVAFYSYSGEI